MIPRDSEGRVNFDKVFNLYKGSETKAVSSQKQFDAAIAEGFGDYVPMEFPRWIYHQKTNDKLKVFSADEEAAKTEYGRVPIKHNDAAEVMAPLPVFVPHNDVSGAIAALENNAKSQAAQIKSLSEQLAQAIELLTAQATPEHKERKRV